MSWFKHWFPGTAKPRAISVKCPECSHETFIKDEYLLGANILCQNCHAEVIVPAFSPGFTKGRPRTAICVVCPSCKHEQLVFEMEGKPGFVSNVSCAACHASISIPQRKD